jgi:hypothetical protein
MGESAGGLVASGVACIEHHWSLVRSVAMESGMSG